MSGVSWCDAVSYVPPGGLGGGLQTDGDLGAHRHAALHVEQRRAGLDGDRLLNGSSVTGCLNASTRAAGSASPPGTVVAASRPIAPAAENSRRDLCELDAPMLLPLEFADRSVRRGVTVADPAMRR